MAMVLGVAIVLAVAVGAAELVRFQCRRMLTTPVRRPAPHPRPARAPLLTSVAARDAKAVGFATAA